MSEGLHGLRQPPGASTGLLAMSRVPCSTDNAETGDSQYAL
ncbi:hypothetical protein [Pseudomonas sp. DG56-2]|nr:hypothetical protein [Pseudomonas sp. DG56-2]